MNAASPLAVASIRNHPKLRDLFKASEARHLTEEELWLYSSVVPYHEERARAAREIAAAEPEAVAATVDEILSLYPFIERFENVRDRCVRDVTYVSIYATHTMLMNDPDWFRDKLLLWLKTIIQAFDSIPTSLPRPINCRRGAARSTIPTHGYGASTGTRSRRRPSGSSKARCNKPATYFPEPEPCKRSRLHYPRTS
jgi:Phycobilisome protein